MLNLKPSNVLSRGGEEGLEGVAGGEGGVGDGVGVAELLAGVVPYPES
jgi:hypothetical protein